jgi:hypothetical protein
MAILADGLSYFARDHSGLYPPSDRMPVRITIASAYGSAQRLSRIARVLAPYYKNGRVPTTDGWGNPLLYIASQDQKHFAIIAVDADAQPNAETAGPAAWPMNQPWRDAIMVDGKFLRYPYGVVCCVPEGIE